MAKNKSDRTIFSGAGGPAQLYLFVEIASFTENWSDLKLGDDELRALENEIARDPCEHLSSRVQAVSGKFAAPTG